MKNLIRRVFFATLVLAVFAAGFLTANYLPVMGAAESNQNPLPTLAALDAINVVPEDDPNAPRATVEIIAQDEYRDRIRFILRVTTDNSNNVLLAGRLAMNKLGYEVLNSNMNILIVNGDVYYMNGEFYAAK